MSGPNPSPTPPATVRAASRAIYFSAVQNIVFDLRVTTSKSEFKQALETPLLHVIYEGHARYGRGPWTVRQTNRELRRIHETYQLI